MVVACKAGYQYNGLTLSCDRTDPSMICPSPADDTKKYYWDDATLKC